MTRVFGGLRLFGLAGLKVQGLDFDITVSDLRRSVQAVFWACRILDVDGCGCDRSYGSDAGSAENLVNIMSLSHLLPAKNLAWPRVSRLRTSHQSWIVSKRLRSGCRCLSQLPKTTSRTQWPAPALLRCFTNHVTERCAYSSASEKYSMRGFLAGKVRKRNDQDNYVCGI